MSSDKSADILFNQIKHKKNTVLVCHSKGCNVVESLLERHPDIMDKTSGLVMMNGATGFFQELGGSLVLGTRFNKHPDARKIPILNICDKGDIVAGITKCTKIEEAENIEEPANHKGNFNDHKFENFSDKTKNRIYEFIKQQGCMQENSIVPNKCIDAENPALDQWCMEIEKRSGKTICSVGAVDRSSDKARVRKKAEMNKLANECNAVPNSCVHLKLPYTFSCHSTLWCGHKCVRIRFISRVGWNRRIHLRIDDELSCAVFHAEVAVMVEYGAKRCAYSHKHQFKKIGNTLSIGQWY